VSRVSTGGLWPGDGKLLKLKASIYCSGGPTVTVLGRVVLVICTDWGGHVPNVGMCRVSKGIFGLDSFLEGSFIFENILASQI